MGAGEAVRRAIVLERTWCLGHHYKFQEPSPESGVHEVAGRTYVRLDQPRSPAHLKTETFVLAVYEVRDGQLSRG